MFLLDGPADAPLTIALAHGAGAPMDSPFMAFFAEGLANRGYHVARFEFPYMAARRAGGNRRPPDQPSVLIETWRTVIAELGAELGAKRLVIGGKSLGGRIASMLADDAGVPTFGARAKAARSRGAATVPPMRARRSGDWHVGRADDKPRRRAEHQFLADPA